MAQKFRRYVIGYNDHGKSVVKRERLGFHAARSCSWYFFVNHISDE